MFLHCESPTWELDDFSQCFRRDFLQALFPLVVIGASFVYLCIQLVVQARESRLYHAYQALDHAEHVRNIRVPGTSGPAPWLHEETDSEDDEFDRSTHLTLQRTITHDSIKETDKPKGELWVVLVEEVAVLTELGLHLAIFVTGVLGEKNEIAAISGIVVWCYLAAIASFRLLFSSSSRWTFPQLWYHTAFSYGFLWAFSLVLFRSAILHPRSGLARNFAIVDFSLVTALFLVALMSRKGNKAVELEFEGDLQPSKEQTASVLSLATFGWVDHIVWKGYWKTYELADIWNLVPRDKAAAVLAEYRLAKKTSSLAFHLLKHFKRSLIAQGLWAAGSGFLTFAPTLLLKAILEYVESPSTTPKNAAWMYVILLFISGCASALADGQALWTGRKICIRLRAVIIGEIYAKALKRKASAGSDKILGEGDKKQQKDLQRPSMLKRAFTFGKRKAQDKAVDTSKKEPEPSDAQVTSGAIINLMAVDSFKVSEICAYLHFLWAATPVQVVMAVYLLYRVMGFSSIAGIGMMVFLLPVNMTIARQFAKVQKAILAATDARIHTTNEVLGNIRIIKFFTWEQRFMALVDEKRALELRRIRHRYLWWSIASTIWSGVPILITFLSFLVYTQVEKKSLVPSVAFTSLSLFQILRIPLDQLADMIAHVQESKVSIDRIEEYLNEPETEKYKQLKEEKEDENGEPVIGFENANFAWGSTETKDGDNFAVFRLMDLDIKFRVNHLNVIAGPTGCGKTSLLMALLGEMKKLTGHVYLPGAHSREDLQPDPETALTNSVAYCAQQAWLVNDTVKENIVFAGPWDAKRYKEVLIACSLTRDLEILDGGDQTLVGEKGVTLSGGQKQRISLARALYSRARHVILDDILSAVDSHTAKWIFEQALMGPLMYNRTCILVTHNVSLCLPHAGFAVVLDNGKVAASGTVDEVIESGKLVEDLSKSKTGSGGPSQIPSRVPSSVGDEAMNEPHQTNGNANGTTNGTVDPTKSAGEKKGHTETKAEGSVKLGIILLYLKSMGPWWYWVIAALLFALHQISSVATNVWIRQWANAHAERQVSVSGVRRVSPVTHVSGISNLGTCLSSGTCAWQMPIFALPKDKEVWAVEQQRVNDGYYLSVYAILGIVFAIITFSREVTLFGGSLHASRQIHSRLIESVCRAKFRFFDSTPLGQIMNRFSKDIEAVDQEIAPVALGVIYCMSSVLTIVVLISVITPGFLIAGFFIAVLYFLIGKFYLASSVNLKRIESVQRSPLYQQFGETLSGMTTIRAYGDERRFIRENLHKINTHSRPFIYLWAANRWLAFRVDVVGALVSFFAGVFVVLSVGHIDPGAAGLAMTYAVTFTENVLWFVRLYSSNEQNMNSIERVKEYLDVEQEAAPIVAHNRPPGNWPSRGSVEFIGYSTRYRSDFDPVLKSITFKIYPGQKVGIVGRTGAGKSSLALALFRALEAEEGKILIDDVDIGLIGLQDLRENIVMVPQDPTLFTGTIRSNLDPFNLFTDEEIFTALRRVQLVGAQVETANATQAGTRGHQRPDSKRYDSPQGSNESGDSPKTSSTAGETTKNTRETIIDMPAPQESSSTAGVSPTDNKNPFLTLSSPVAESGSNLSQGQRQLLCLARAILKNPKVLLMDEATASIDYATDAKIQETIREIKNTTITIAHRLQTIIDYDAVLVLDHGKVVEFGDPWELLQKGKKQQRQDANAEDAPRAQDEPGVFRGMCEMSGDLDILEEEAKKAWENKKSLNGDRFSGLS